MTQKIYKAGSGKLFTVECKAGKRAMAGKARSGETCLSAHCACRLEEDVRGAPPAKTDEIRRRRPELLAEQITDTAAKIEEAREYDRQARAEYHARTPLKDILDAVSPIFRPV